MNLDQAVVYDIETFPNVFTLHAEMLHQDVSSTWEISDFCDNRNQLIQWFNWLNQTQTPMIGFNNEHFDYPVIHAIMKNPQLSVAEIFQVAMQIINSNDRFAHMIWKSDRFAPQIDLFKIHHFDNRAKTTSLKALEINMRSHTVADPIGTEIPLGQPLSRQQIDSVLIPYNIHDVKETKRFAHYSLPAINFRIGLLNKVPGDIMNFNDTKIGAKILEQRLGEEICYDRSTGRKRPRQSVRHEIALNDIIFPYIYFKNPEFKRVLDFLKQQVLRSEEIRDLETGQSEQSMIKTKGVFNGLKASVGGIEFHFGTGGIHGSVSSQFVQATDEWLIRDIDVASLYPSIAVVNNLRPEHLGEAFSVEYEGLLIERRTHKKGTVENASLKLAANGTYGNSNSKFSVFYDPKFTMTITVNGQLMLCMLAEMLLEVPTLQFIQINTDGITYRVHRDYEPKAKEICEIWEKYTLLKLEDADYSRMWIRDVNNYVAEKKLPNVLNKYHGNIPDDAVYCGRGTKWGNPFIIGKDGTRNQVCDKFEREILPSLDVSELKGKQLVCFCAPKRCHCDALVLKANSEGRLKQKGAYWHPDPNDYAESISTAGPPAWHKDFNPIVVTKAAVAAMTQGVDVETYIRLQHDPYDFMCRVKVDRSSKLMLGNRQLQSTTRYYVAVNGEEMRKVSPPAKGAVIGEYRRANKLTDAYFNQVMSEIGPGVWDERIHTKNKSKYAMRETSIQAGWKIAECNDARSFDFNNVNYDWYISETKKLIIS